MGVLLICPIGFDVHQNSLTLCFHNVSQFNKFLKFFELHHKLSISQLNNGNYAKFIHSRFVHSHIDIVH